ncbi:hypothetical protein TRVA0_001S02366 [Trichomonascus vanleenenianus]|uniref:Slk19p n=1 Tax=Trichomonascus vanleenenianus TaxID=2268995 RepID=UPI003ECA4736
MDGDLIDLSDDPFYERNNGAKRVNEERRAQSFIPPPSAVRRKKRKSLTESIERRRSGEYRVLGSPKRLPPEFWASSAEFIYQEPQPYQEPNPGSNEEPEPNQEIEEPELEDQNYRDNDQENYQENYRDNDQENYRDNDQEELQREPIGYEAASDDYDAYNSSANGQLSLLEPEYYDEPMLNNDQNSELRYEEQLANLEAKQQAEIASYHAQLAGRDREISALRTALEESERQLSANLRQRSELVTKVSTRLHEQYSRKHQVKVTALKKAYEARWQSRVSRLEAEVSRLQELVKKERQEKNELVKTCDQFLDMMNQSGQ